MGNEFRRDVESKTLDKGVPAWAVKKGPDAVAPIPSVPGSTTVEETFDTLPLWSQISFGGNSGTGVWATATDSFHSSPKSFKSPALSSGQSSTFTIFNDTFDPQVSFWMRVDGGNAVGPLLDGVVVSVDGTPVLTVSDFDTGWIRYAINIGFGYQIDFTYQMDHAAFTDRAWVDNIVFGSLDIPAVPGSPAHPLVYAPLQLTDDGVRLKVDAAFAASQHVIVDSLPEVEIKNDVGNPVPVSGTVAATQGTSPWVVGTHAVTQGTSPWVVSGAVTVSDGSGPLTVDGTVTANQGTSPWVVSGTVNIGTIPEVEIKNDTGNPVPVNGTVNIGTMPEVEIKNDAGNPLPVTTNVVTGTLANGAETAVAGSAVQVLAANANRRKLIVQNTGLTNVRIGVTGVTATTGMRLVPNGHMILDMPNCPTQAIFAIREGAVSSTVLAQEMT